MAFVGMLLIINSLLLGFSGTSISDQGYFITPFMIYVIIQSNIFKKQVDQSHAKIEK